MRMAGASEIKIAGSWNQTHDLVATALAIRRQLWTYLAPEVFDARL